jgi:nicotinate-nucleotide adenylyltransferase
VAVRRAGQPPLDLDLLRGIAAAERIDQARRCQVEMPEIGLSGTDIRGRVAQGLGIRYRTPRAVEKFIETHGLYRH